jgi:hypothetical protein
VTLARKLAAIPLHVWKRENATIQPTIENDGVESQREPWVALRAPSASRAARAFTWCVASMKQFESGTYLRSFHRAKDELSRSV